MDFDGLLDELQRMQWVIPIFKIIAQTTNEKYLSFICDQEIWNLIHNSLIYNIDNYLKNTSKTPIKAWASKHILRNFLISAQLSNQVFELEQIFVYGSALAFHPSEIFRNAFFTAEIQEG